MISSFLDQAMYRFHPQLTNLRSLATGACQPPQGVRGSIHADGALGNALEVLRPGVERKRFRAYVKELKAQKWKVTYNISSMPPVPASVIPANTDPPLEVIEEHLEEVTDETEVDANGDLVRQETSAEEPGHVLVRATPEPTTSQRTHISESTVGGDNGGNSNGEQSQRRSGRTGSKLKRGIDDDSEEEEDTPDRGAASGAKRSKTE